MKNARLLVLTTVVFWSFGSYLGRLMAINSVYIMIELALLTAFITFTVYSYFRAGRSFKGFFKLFRFKYMLWGVLGSAVYAIASAFSFIAYDSASETNILNYTWPVFTVVFTELLFRKSRKTGMFRVLEIFGIVTSFFSVVVLATEGDLSSFDFTNIPGLAWGLIAPLAYGLYSAYTSTVPEEDNPSFLMSSIFAGILLTFPFIFSEMHLVKELSFAAIIPALISGGVVDALGEITWTRANRVAYEQRIDVSKIASLALLLPITSTVVISLFLGETKVFNGYFLVSLGLILVGSFICQRTEGVVDFIRKRFSLNLSK